MHIRIYMYISLLNVCLIFAVDVLLRYFVAEPKCPDWAYICTTWDVYLGKPFYVDSISKIRFTLSTETEPVVLCAVWLRFCGRRNIHLSRRFISEPEWSLLVSIDALFFVTLYVLFAWHPVWLHRLLPWFCQRFRCVTVFILTSRSYNYTFRIKFTFAIWFRYFYL